MGVTAHASLTGARPSSILRSMGCVQSNATDKDQTIQDSFTVLMANGPYTDDQPKPGPPSNDIKVLLLGASQSGKVGYTVHPLCGHHSLTFHSFLSLHS